MGRKSIKIELIKDERKRQATLEKRKFGLFKKAHELGILCGIKISVHIFNNENTLSRYTSDGQHEFDKIYSHIDKYHVDQDLTEQSMTPLIGVKNINGKRPLETGYSADSTSFEDDDKDERYFQYQLNQFGVNKEYQKIRPTDINPHEKQRKLMECHTTSSTSSSTSSFTAPKPIDSSPIYDSSEQFVRQDKQEHYIFPSSDNNVFEPHPSTIRGFPFELKENSDINCFNNNYHHNNNTTNPLVTNIRKNTYENCNSYLDGEIYSIYSGNTNELDDTDSHNFNVSNSSLIHDSSNSTDIYGINKPDILNLDKSIIFNPDSLLETPETEIVDLPCIRQ